MITDDLYNEIVNYLKEKIDFWVYIYKKETFDGIQIHSKKKQKKIIQNEIERLNSMLEDHFESFRAYYFNDYTFNEEEFFESSKGGFYECDENILFDELIETKTFENLRYEYVRCRYFQIAINKKIEFENGELNLIKIDNKEELPKESQIKTFKTLKWHGTKIDLIELSKALVENGTLKGTQKDIIDSLGAFFDIDTTNQDKTINDMKKRNNGSETKFLTSLKLSLYKFITKENIR